MGKTVKAAFVDQGYTGKGQAAAAREEDLRLHVVKLPQAKKRFALLPLYSVVFTILMLGNTVSLLKSSSPDLIGGVFK